MDGIDVHCHDADPFSPALDTYQIQFTEIWDNQIKGRGSHYLESQKQLADANSKNELSEYWRGKTGASYTDISVFAVGLLWLKQVRISIPSRKFLK